MYEKLYDWHTREIQSYDKKRLTATGQEQKKIETVEKRLIVERKRIRKIYPEEFKEDGFDALLGSPTIE